MNTIRMKNIGIYALYIIIACGVTSGLNIFHTKYVLNVELRPLLFLIPIIAGVIFGFTLAQFRIATAILHDPSDLLIFIQYIVMSCFVTSALNIAHTEWILEETLEKNMFIAPILAGIFFGYLLARIKTMNKHLSILATTDVLTKAYNRLHFEKILAAEIDRAKRYKGAFSIIYFDIDHFKDVNDKFGHQAGDLVLKKLVQVINKNKRISDVLARYGGEEFIIFSPDLTEENALLYSNRLRTTIQNTNFDNIGSITCSFGITSYENTTDTITNILKSVDDALYKAKAKGRNCVISSDDSEITNQLINQT